MSRKDKGVITMWISEKEEEFMKGFLLDFIKVSKANKIFSNYYRN
jgi:hypothetical protein